MKKLHLIIALIIGLNVHAQEFQWAKSMGGIENERRGSIGTDSSKNVYTVGSYTDFADFDPGEDEFILYANGNSDIFVQKLGLDGRFQWAISIGGSEFDVGETISIDKDDNLYLTGYFSGIVDFDPGPSVFNLISSGYADIFVLKLDASGNFIWAKKTGGSFEDRGFFITTDDLGNIYTTGFFMGTADFDPGNGVYELVSNGSADIFIQKMDTFGNFIWAKAMGGIDVDLGLGITIDIEYNVILTGSFRDTVDFDPGNGIFNLISNGDKDIFIQKLNSAGNFVWAKAIGGVVSDKGQAITIDTFGNIYITGSYMSQVDFDPGNGTATLISNGFTDIYILKINSEGSFLWAKSIGSSGWDVAKQIMTSDNGNVFITGTFWDSIDFDPNQTNYYLQSNGESDIFLLTLNISGEFLNAISMGGIDVDFDPTLAFGDSGTLYFSGSFKETVDFDPGNGTYNLASNGGSDIFILKLSHPLLSNTENDFEPNLVSYPNPTTGKFSIAIGQTYQNIEISIFNSIGQLISENKFTNKNNIDITINGSDGIYFIQFEADGNKNATIKIVKE